MTEQNQTICEFTFKDGKPGTIFQSDLWFQRGRCIHNLETYDQCRNVLRDVIEAQDALFATEYNASASTLALVPTVGALFGAPTPEIWLLSKLIPFAGALSVLLSFGGSIVPSDVDDYRSVLARRAIVLSNPANKARRSRLKAKDLQPKIPTITERYQISLHGGADEGDPFVTGPPEIVQVPDLFVDEVIEEIRHRLDFPAVSECDSPAAEQFLTDIPLAGAQKLPLRAIVVGCVAMVMLLAGVQAAIVVVEIGAVYTTWCTSTWWMHAWYLVITAASFLDSWVQLPLHEHWKLYLTTVPDHVRPVSTSRLSTDLEMQSTEALSKVKALKAFLYRQPLASLAAEQSWRTAQSTLVVITTERSEREAGSIWRWAAQIFSKGVSLTIFVFATSVFAAVTLLALPMAQMILIVLLGAGMGGRYIASSIVSTIHRSAPMIHILAKDEEQADNIIRAILSLKSRSAKLQIESEGHIFIDDRKVAQRSRWWRVVFGVLAHAPRITPTRTESR